MPELSEKTIDKLNEKVNFSKAFSAVNSLYAARSCLNDEVVHDLGLLVKKLDAITEGHVDEDGDELFYMADELEDDIVTAQERLEKIYDVLSSINECWPDPDEKLIYSIFMEAGKADHCVRLFIVMLLLQYNG